MKIRNLLPFLCLACATAWADNVTIALDSPLINASPGQQVTFSAVIANNELATVDLNDISISLNGMFTVDDTPFFSGPATLAGSTLVTQSETSDFALFNVTVDLPYTDPSGILSGTITILGGVEGAGGYDPTAEDVLGSATFSLDVDSLDVSSVPEPSGLTLIVTGAGLVFLSRRRMGRKSGVKLFGLPGGAQKTGFRAPPRTS
jgi:hypothetical protein